MTVNHSSQPPEHQRTSPSPIAPKFPGSPFVAKFAHLTGMPDLASTELRLRHMGRLTTQERAEFKTLDAAYRQAWTRLILQVSYWQSLNVERNADSVALQRAWEEVERAEASYRQSRNQLAEYILPTALQAKQLVSCC
jgi:hypothetical protein